MTSALLLQTCVLLLLAGALVSLACARNRALAGWVSVAFVAAACLPLARVVVNVFSGVAEGETVLLALPALAARLTVHVDALSAFFLVLTGVIAVLSTLFSVRYMEHFEKDTVAKFYPVLLVFFASMVALLVVTDMLFFLVFWELMTLSSFFLVIFERERKDSQRAGLKYFVITHAATLCMVAGTLVLWRRAGSFSFAALQDALGVLLAEQAVVAHLVLFLFFVGFATKAGVLPMGDWLPDAHPAAPSGVSAALSGVLVKLGIYGLIRVFCSFLPVSAASDAWGVVLALAGTASLFVGTLTALRQTDSKRLMAFHTIGQIGYICLGLGVGVACLRTSPTIAALALLGALFHAANHACFKACLFLGAGAVLHRTGERDMDRLGGLAASMPVTAASTTVAALSISGVPPFNGFTSKWLIVAACILGGQQHPLFLVLGLVGMFISLATLASFLKVLGAVFMGARDESRRVNEVPLSMALPQVVLAALCVLLGVFPRVPLGVLRDAVASAVRIEVPGADALLGTGFGLGLTAGGFELAFWAPLVVVLALVLGGALAYAIQRAGAAKVREVPVWTCGELDSSAAVRYPASSFYLPFKHAFAGIYPALHARVPQFPGALRRAFNVDTWLYRPVVRAVDGLARGVSRSHVGVPQVYLLWIAVGAVVVVAVMLALTR